MPEGKRCLRHLWERQTRQRQRRSLERRVGRQHAQVVVALRAVTLRARWRYQRGKADNQLLRREVQLDGMNSNLCTLHCTALAWLPTARLAVLLDAALNELTARLEVQEGKRLKPQPNRRPALAGRHNPRTS